MGRHELREHIFKLLFRIEFNDMEDMPEQVRLFLEDSESIKSEKDAAYIEDKYQKISEKLSEIDGIINQYAEGWDITRMGKVEVTVLRLAVYEILFDDNIPGSVAINEAVEIAKQYGQENSGGFVNAVLAKIVKLGD
ncbi:MAG: transcription antitermination factor NusB [Bacteroidales bacterium]|nr:transcription antitermination factor NusB [Lachnoclostridium sp.]MCM1385634.1 transcription antitermination factor NusB [Lachnoclostridium sp.]MCM1465962.1 transcription antitermination factor NusB [Bacteroidales bacterium]